jgi:hypothetical protein
MLLWARVQRTSASCWSVSGALGILAGAVILGGAPGVALADADKPLSHVEVVSVMSMRRGPIRKKCYEDSATKADTSIRVDFVVAPNGIVTDVVPRDVVGPAAIVSCVTAEMKKTVFPSSGSGGRFRWPFIFKGP